MKKSIIILALFVLFFLVSPSVYAQAPSTFKVPDATCGIAGDPNANKCCDLSFTKSFDNQTGDATSIIPSGLSALFSGILHILSPVLTDVPVYQIATGPCVDGIPDGEGSACKCVYPPTTDVKPELQAICKQYLIPNKWSTPEESKALANELNACIKCAAVDHGFYSGLGCIPDNLSDFISNFVLRIGIGIAGFIAMMCIIYSSFLLQVSKGNPEMITKAREQITSCIIGLMMIIFSVFILRLIGVDILRIPGFS